MIFMSLFLPPLKFTLTGIVKNEKTNEPIIALAIKSISSDGMTVESSTDKDGSFKFDLKPATDYVLLLRKKVSCKGKNEKQPKARKPVPILRPQFIFLQLTNQSESTISFSILPVQI